MREFIWSRNWTYRPNQDASRDGKGHGILVDVQAEVMHDFIHGCLASLLCYQWPSFSPGFNTVDRSASADNPRSNKSNTRSFTLLSHKV